MIPKWLQEFPTHNASVVAGLFVFVLTGIVAAVKLALGQPFPDNYTVWIGAIVTIAGVTTAGGIGKRLTDSAYVAAKKTAPAPTNITMQAPSTMEVKP
jgi:hypothetical protein